MDESKLDDELRLTVRQAYWALSDFIYDYTHNTGSVDIVDLEGDVTVDPVDLGPMDPAMMSAWMESVDRIRAGLPPRSDWKRVGDSSA